MDEKLVCSKHPEENLSIVDRTSRVVTLYPCFRCFEEAFRQGFQAGIKTERELNDLPRKYGN